LTRSYCLVLSLCNLELQSQRVPGMTSAEAHYQAGLAALEKNDLAAAEEEEAGRQGSKDEKLGEKTAERWKALSAKLLTLDPPTAGVSSSPC